MRLLRLEMSGFGAYAGRQEIRFDQLNGNTLFLIHGATGAGKTTILDAISFALYGETSGGERDGRQMRSQHAEAQTATEVTLDFALGDKAYRVRRNPEYERPARRGGGLTRERSAALVHQLLREDGGWREGGVLAHQANTVSDKVRELLGLDAQQFRQVVILPQGQFRRLLSGKSDEREKILEVLFGTERFAGLQGIMKARAHALEREADELRRRERDLLAHSGVESATALIEHLAGLRQEEARAGERIAELRTLAQAARTAREAGQAALARFAELAEAEAALAQVEADASRLEAVRNRCETARRAARLATDQARLDEAETRLKRAEGSLVVRSGERTAAERARAQASARVEAERAGLPERDEARREAERLAALEHDLAEAYRAKAEAARLEVAGRAAASSLERIGRELDAAMTEGGAAQARLEAAGAAAVALPGLEAEAREWARLRGERLRLALDEDAASGQEQARIRQEAQRHEAVVRVERLRRDIDRLDRLLRTGSAAALASGLVGGEPCPVCGSREHPAPATSVEPPPGEEVLQAAREALTTADEDARRLGEALVRVEAQHAALVERIGQRRQALGENAARTLAELEAADGAVQGTLKETRERAAGLDEARAKSEAARERVERLAREREEATAQAHGRAAEAAAAIISADRALDRVPVKLRGAADLALAEQQRRRAVEAAQARQRALEQALRDAEGSAQAATAALSAAAARHDAAVAETQGARAKREEMAAGLAEAAARAGFPDLDAYRAATLDPAELERLGAELAQAGERRRSVDDWLARARAQVEGLSRPDIEALEAREKEAEQALDQASEALGAHRKQIDQLDGVARQIAGIAPGLQVLETRFGVLGRLADIANGTAPGSYRITFQRFVLGAFLDEVLDAASQRLRVMSQGRYVLRRLDPEVSGGKRSVSAGLDLEVDDAWTGKTRHVATLSGGEGFLAALALALGLADVVQARAGGRRLDTIFIDEGFGSLDSEALDLSLKVLTELQRGGRLVGLISHVPELRERIDVRLEVLKSERGSTAQFRLP